MANGSDLYRDLLNSFVSDCVNGSSGAPILGHLPQRRVVCVDHPGGPFMMQSGVEPTVDTECVVCQFTRQEKESKEKYRKSLARLKKPAQTKEELERAGNPFDRLKGE